jgi:ABC-type sugar transport system substrate-binding protein
MQADGRRHRVVRALPALIAIVTVIAACTASATPSPSAGTKKWSLGFSQIGLTGPFLVGDSYGVVDEAKVLGQDMTFLEAGGFGGLNKQISNTENLIQRPVNALLLDPISGDALAPLVTRAIGAKIPVIGVGDPITQSDPLIAAVTSSHEEIGQGMGDAVVKLFNNAPARVVILGGPGGAEWSTRREKAFEAVISKQSNFKILTVQFFDDVSRAKGLALTEDFMKTFPDANLFYAADNAIGLGVADAVKTANKGGQVRIVTSVVDRDTIDMIKAGIISVDIAQQVVLIGRLGVRTALDMLNGKKVAAQTIVPVVTVTKDNIDQVNFDTMIAPEGWKP